MRRLATLTMLLILTGCAAIGQQPLADQDRASVMAWPAPPQQARIEFKQVFNGPDSLGYRESFSRRVGTLIAGGVSQHMARPYGLAVNDRLVVVADPGAGLLHIFDRREKRYRTLNEASKTRFVSPIGVALGDDRIFLADSELQQVFVLSEKGKLLETIVGFMRPTGLAYDPVRQRLFVSDTLAHQVHVYGENWKRLRIIGSRGEQANQFNYPSHLAFARNHLYVNDTMNFRIKVFDPEGRFISSIGGHGADAGLFSQPKGVAVDSEGHIYVVDAFVNHVQIFDPEDRFLLSFGQGGNGPGTFSLPMGIAIWNDEIYVADSHNQRVQVFKYLRDGH